jgi:hypothetical protein
MGKDGENAEENKRGAICMSEVLQNPDQNLILSSKEVQAYFQDVENGKKLFKVKLKDSKEAFRDEMKTYKRYMRGMFTAKEIGMENAVPLNEFHTAVDTLKPNLYFSNPYVNVIPMTDKFSVKKLGTDKAQDVPAAQQAQNAEFVLNYTSEIELDDEKLFNDCLEDALVPSFAVHKSGWIYKSQVNMNEVEWGNNKTAEQRAAEGQMETLMALKNAVGDGVEGEKPIEIPTTEEDRLYSGRVSPFEIVVDPECEDWEQLEQARYVAEFHKINTKYANSIWDLKLSGGSTDAWSDGTEDNDIVQLNLKQSLIYEIWDKQKQRIVWLSPEVPDKALHVDPWWKLPEYPYEFLMFGRENDRALPIPWFRMWKDLVFEKMRIVSKLSELNRRLYQTYLADSRIAGQLDELLDGVSGNVVPVERKNNEDLSQFIKMVADFTINPSYFEYIQLVNSEIDRHSGLTDTTKGLISKTKRTASELMQLQQAQNVRLGFMQKRFKKFILRIFNKRFNLLQTHQALSKQIYGKVGGKQVNLNWNMDSIAMTAGKFYFDLDVNSMVKKNKEVEKKQSIEKLHELAAFPMYENIKKDIEDVHKAYDDDNIQDRVHDAPPPPPPPPPPKPELRLSLSLKAEDLGLPMVQELLKQEGVTLNLPAANLPAAPPPASPPGAGPMATGLIPPKPENAASMAVDINKGAMSV